MILQVIVLFLSRQVVGVPIIGGHITDISVLPWMAAIHIDGSFACGGTIISERIILTAAHCVTDQKNLKVIVGSSRIDGAGGSTHQVVETKCHEHFDLGHLINDVALLKVSPPLNFGSNVKPVSLASRGDHLEGDHVIANVAGWGYTSVSGVASSVLKSTNLIIVNTAECARIYDDFSDYELAGLNRLICAVANRADSCDGDSGGPLIVDHVQFGIVSWGYGCAKPKHPGFYTNVPFHRDWIDTNSRILESSKAGSDTQVALKKAFLKAFWEWSSNAAFFY